MIKAVIFDFDGLILDTETAWYDAYKKVLKEQFQFDLPLEEFVKCVGSNDTVLSSYLIQAIGNHLEIDDIKKRTGALHEQVMKEAKSCEGVATYLADARAAGLKIALTTSSTLGWVTNHLTNLNLLSYFDHLITKEDVKHVKPAPDLYLKTIEMLDIEPHEAVVFEDSLNGLQAALKAKLPTVIIPNPVTASSPFENYHLKLTSMSEMDLYDIIASLNK